MWQLYEFFCPPMSLCRLYSAAIDVLSKTKNKKNETAKLDKTNMEIYR